MARIGDAEVAAALRAGLVAGLFTHGEVVAWADQRIEAEARPTEWLIDLSMVRDVNALLGTLGELERGANAAVALGLLYSRLLVELADEPTVANGWMVLSHAWGAARALSEEIDDFAWSVTVELGIIEEAASISAEGPCPASEMRRLVADLRDLLRRHALPPDVPDPLSNL